MSAWKHLKDNEETIFKLLAYSACRLSHAYQVLKKANLLKYEISRDIAYINTESLIKQSFVMFFPASFVKELRNLNSSTLGESTYLKKSLRHSKVSARRSANGTLT
jgi:intergrase/recombinase